MDRDKGVERYRHGDRDLWMQMKIKTKIETEMQMNMTVSSLVLSSSDILLACCRLRLPEGSDAPELRQLCAGKRLG